MAAIPLGIIAYIYAKKLHPVVEQQNAVMASINVRIVAYIIDSLILVLIASLLRYVLELVNVEILNNSPLLYVLTISFFYFPFLESSELKASIGKRIMKLQVVSIQGERLTYSKALIRYILSLISSFSLCVGNLLALFTKYNQTLHDVFTKTLVIYGPADVDSTKKQDPESVTL